MKKILVVVLTYDFHFGIFPRIWENTISINRPDGYQVDFVAVMDSTEINKPNYPEFKK